MNLETTLVSEIMNPIVKTGNEDKNIMSACKIMHKNKIGCVIIVTIVGDGTPVGIITYRDIINLLGEKVNEEIPIFIIGLPDDPLDSELAKSKFTNLVRLLKKAYPNLEEARCRIKIRQVQGARKRYEIDASIITTQSVASYVTVGWDYRKCLIR